MARHHQWQQHMTVRVHTEQARQQSHVLPDMFFTCNLSRVSFSCIRTGALHNSRHPLCKDRELWDRDRRGNRYAETDTVHKLSTYINKYVQPMTTTILQTTSPLDHVSTLRVCVSVIQCCCQMSSIVFLLLFFLNTSFLEDRAIKNANLLCNPLFKNKQQTTLPWQTIWARCPFLFINTAAFNWPQYTLHRLMLK